MKIGVIDSGLGGITTLRELMGMVHAEYIYYMDNANVPYGDKDETKLRRIASDIVEYLLSKGVDIIVVACNTLSAVAGQYLRNKYDVQIVLIEPSINLASIEGGRTLVLATPNTVKSDKFNRLISRYDDTEVVASHCLATLIENNDMDKAKDELERILAGRTIENIVLGCTHYVYLKDYLVGRGYKVFEGNRGVSLRVLNIAHKMGYIRVNKHSIVHIKYTKLVDIEKVTRYLRAPVRLM